MSTKKCKHFVKLMDPGTVTAEETLQIGIYS